MSGRALSPVRAGPSQKGKQRSHDRDVSEQPTYPHKRAKMHEAGPSTEQSQDSDETMAGTGDTMGAAESLKKALPLDCAGLTRLLEELDRESITSDRQTKLEAENALAQKFTTSLDETIEDSRKYKGWDILRIIRALQGLIRSLHSCA